MSLKEKMMWSALYGKKICFEEYFTESLSLLKDAIVNLHKYPMLLEKFKKEKNLDDEVGSSYIQNCLGAELRDFLIKEILGD